jgi:hypothetical protein
VTPEEARSIIADQLIANAIDAYECLWEDFPEIGAHDWTDIVDTFVGRVKSFDQGVDNVEVAVRLLAERADHE